MTRTATAPDVLERATFLKAGHYLTVKQAAATLGISISAVRKAEKQGHILSKNIGGLIVISTVEVDQYACYRREGPATTQYQQDFNEAARRRVSNRGWVSDKRPAFITYSSPHGEKMRLTPPMAETIRFLKLHQTSIEEPVLVATIVGASWWEGTRGKAVHMLYRMREKGLIYRHLGRDHAGVAVTHVVISHIGEDAYSYARSRGLL